MDRIRWTVMALGGAAMASGAFAVTGPGIPKVTFAAAEVGKRVVQITGLTERVPKGMMFQGYFMVFNNRCNRIDVFDLTDPHKPKTISSFTQSGQGDDHTVPTAGTMVMDGGTLTDMADPANPKVVGRNAGFYGSVWPAFQWPYFYSTRSYDDANAKSSPLYIVDYSNPGAAGKQVNQIDVQSKLGFTTGSTQAIGNLLMVTSGDQYAGISVWDMGDPVHPTLISATKTGPEMYTSQMYGKYVVSTGPQNLGTVGFFDISNPESIKLEWQESIPNMGDYAGFQNGFMFGGKIGGGKWIKYDLAARKTVLTGTIPNYSTSRYVYPIGNMLFVGDPGRDGPNGQNSMCDIYAHQENPDSIGPTVLFADPPDGAIHQPLSSRIGIAFDEDIDNRLLDPAHLSIRPKDGAPIPGVYGQSNGVVNFTPAQPLKLNTTYEVVLAPGAIKDWTGNANALGYMLRFSTGATVDGGPASGIRPGPRAMWRARTRLLAESLPGRSALLLTFKDGLDVSAASVAGSAGSRAEVELSDLAGRSLAHARVPMGDLRNGWVWDWAQGRAAPKGFFVVRMSSGGLRFSRQVMLGAGS